MIFPATTSLFAGLLALLYLGLAVWVMVGRTTKNALMGEGDDDLAKRIRAHANMGEFVPFCLILLGLLEAGGGSRTLVLGLGILLLLGRILHPFGLFAAPNSARQFACRGGGILATLVVLLVSAVALILRVV